jgi:hypothetical protein
MLRMFNETDRRYEQRFDAQEKAVRTALAAMEERFRSVNEFRAVLGDQSRNFATRAEVDAQNAALAQRLEDNSTRIAAIEGDLKALAGRSGGMHTSWGILVATIAMVAAGATIVAVMTGS